MSIPDRAFSILHGMRSTLFRFADGSPIIDAAAIIGRLMSPEILKNDRRDDFLR